MDKSANPDHIESILSKWKPVIGKDYEAYRNHVIRMATFCLILNDCSDEEQQKIEIAACFHDIGLWTDNTLDYLEPSVPPARQYLEEQSLSHWAEEIAQMILQHHKLRPVTDGLSPLVELFRKGDLVDFSLGLVRVGVSKQALREVKSKWPNAGFHKMLMQRLGGWFIKHPLNPAPMMKW